MFPCAVLPWFSLLFADSSSNLSLCPPCFSLCLPARVLPSKDLFLGGQLSSAYRPIKQNENAPANSPRRALGRAGTLGPHLCAGRLGAVAASRLVQSGGQQLRGFPGVAGGREDSGGGPVRHLGRAELELPWPTLCRWNAGHQLQSVGGR